MIADDEMKPEEKPLYQNQMEDPEVVAAYDDCLNLLLDSSSDTLPDL